MHFTLLYAAAFTLYYVDVERYGLQLRWWVGFTFEERGNQECAKVLLNFEVGFPFRNRLAISNLCSAISKLYKVANCTEHHHWREACLMSIQNHYGEENERKGFKGVSTPNTLQCASEAGFWTSSKRSVLMRTDALSRVYTILFAHNLAAVHGERFPSSCITGKENAILWRIRERMVRHAAQQHEREKASAKAKEDMLSWNARVIWEEFFKIYRCALL